MSTDKRAATFTISLESAIAMTDISRRTWWRRIEKGTVTKLPADQRGRTMLVFDEIRSEIALHLDDDDVQVLAQADGGNALAQAEIGAMFALALQNVTEVTPKSANSFYTSALYWLEQAAAQDQADAMHWLGILHSNCSADNNNKNLSLMWIARAAANGHAIAQAQITALTTFPKS